MIRLFLKLIFFFLVTLQVNGQNNYPQDYFISPLDIPLKLSGTFGELRSGHFHSGIDIKTGEVEGLTLYAIADGYVSRIKIQAGGYGKALYITHPNGYVSVYGHLGKFNDDIGEFVRDKQYEQESYTQDFYPEPNTIVVKQGEIIAYTGNSGRSGGPHLHFEVRDEGSQKPINPLYFGFRVSDNLAPVINLLKIYPYGARAHIIGRQGAIDVYPVAQKQGYSLPGNDTLHIGGTFYLGVNTIDLFNGGINKNGVYKIQVLIDSVTVYEHELETFSFAETRYINSLIDYAEYKTQRRRIQKTYRQPNNKLSIYKKIENEGIFKLNEGQTHTITYLVSDFAGNTSALNFPVIGDKPLNISKIEPSGTLFSYDQSNTFYNADIKLMIPEGALYDTIHFNYEVSPGPEGAYSSIHHLHNQTTPLHTWCNLSIKTDTMPADLLGKALIAYIDEDGEITSAGGYYKDNFIHTQIRDFGLYCIVVDTIPPAIIPLNISNNKSLLAQQTIKVKIDDDLAGIESYRGTLNGQWILMEYDEKNDLLTYYFDRYLLDGENTFTLEVTDKRDNRATYSATLRY